MAMPCQLLPEVKFYTHRPPVAHMHTQESSHSMETIQIAIKRHYMSMYVFKTENSTKLNRRHEKLNLIEITFDCAENTMDKPVRHRDI